METGRSGDVLLSLQKAYRGSANDYDMDMTLVDLLFWRHE